MRFVVAGSILFAVLAVLAAQLGWFDAAAPAPAATASAAMKPAEASRSPAAAAAEEVEDGADAAPFDEEAPLALGPLDVTVTRALAADDAEAEDVLPEHMRDSAPDEESTDGTEEPMAGVALRVDCPHLALTGKTGPDGRAHFEGVPAESCTLAVREPGMAAQVREFEGGEDTEVSVSLSPEARLVIQVRDGHGRPVPGARVHLLSMEGVPMLPLLREVAPGALALPPPPPPGSEEEGGPAVDGDSDVALGDEDAVLLVPASGELALSGLSAMAVTLTATAAGYTAATIEFGLGSGGSRAVAVVLDAVARVSVRVEGLDDLSRATVTVRRDGEEGEAPTELELDERGSFASDDVSPGEAWLAVAVDGVEVHQEKLALAPGAAAQRVVRLVLADIEVEVRGAPAPAQVGCVQAIGNRRALNEALAIDLEPDSQAVPRLALAMTPPPYGQAVPERAAAGPTKAGCRSTPEPSVALTCAGDLSRTTQAVGGVAHFPLVPQGARCTAALADRPLGSSVSVTAPGRAVLDAAPRVVRFALPGGEGGPAQATAAAGPPTLSDAVDAARAQRVGGVGHPQVRAVAGPLVSFTLTDVADPARAQHVGGMGAVLVEGLRAGRYLLRGWADSQALAMAVDVTAAAEQDVVLRPSAPVCFRARVVDADTGEAVPADFAGYLRAAAGLTASSDEPHPLTLGAGVCYPAAGLARLVISAAGYRTQAFEPRADLGTVRLAPAGDVVPALAEQLRVDADGSVLVASATSYGLRPGDRLLAIDGERLEGLVFEEVLSRLSTAPHHRLHLKVRSVDGEREVEAEPE